VSASVFSPSGDRLARAGMDGKVTVRSAPDGALLFTLRPAGGPVTSVAFDPAGRMLVTATVLGAVDLWDARDGSLVMSLRRKRSGEMVSAAFSDDSRRVLAATYSSVLEWNVGDGRRLPKRRVGALDLTRAVYGRGQQMAVADWGGEVLIWDAAHRSKPWVVQSAHGAANSLAYSPDGRLLAGGTDSGAAVVWDARSGRELAVLDAGGEFVGAVQFTKDGRRLLTASDDGSVRFFNWRAQSGALLASSNRIAEAVSVSPDRRYLALTADYGTGVLVRCPGCAPLASLKAAAGRTAPLLGEADRKKYLHEGAPPKQDPY
jgi:WD40 repeat protein